MSRATSQPCVYEDLCMPRVRRKRKNVPPETRFQQLKNLWIGAGIGESFPGNDLLRVSFGNTAGGCVAHLGGGVRIEMVPETAWSGSGNDRP